MLARIDTRSFAGSDLDSVVELWNRCLPKDRLTVERFWRLFLLDPNFSPDGARFATAGGRVVGYLQAICRKAIPGYALDDPRAGWITTFFVDREWRRQGVARTMLSEGLSFLRSQGCASVTCNGYAPYYAFPGVDHEYLEALSFLSSEGFEPLAEAVAMRLSLVGLKVPDEVLRRRKSLLADGIEVRWFRTLDTLPLLAFAEAHFPYWVSGILDGLQRDNRDIMLAIRGDEVLGYTQWQNTQTDPPNGAPGRFGPFGVNPELRNQGVGAAIFWAVAEKGARELWFGWAGGRNLSFYERAGCEVTRRFRLFRREVNQIHAQPFLLKSNG